MSWFSSYEGGNKLIWRRFSGKICIIGIVVSTTSYISPAQYVATLTALTVGIKGLTLNHPGRPLLKPALRNISTNIKGFSRDKIFYPNYVVAYNVNSCVCKRPFEILTKAGYTFLDCHLTPRCVYCRATSNRVCIENVHKTDRLANMT